MKAIPLAILALAALLATPAHAQVKRGGFFGFGNKNSEQISSGLFPDGSTYADQQGQPAPSSNENIFRQGEPEDVEAVSYVIENGEKVKREIPAKVEEEESRKKGFFSFGKKDEAAADEALEPVPSYPDSSEPAPRMAASNPGPVDTSDAPLEQSDAIQARPVEEKSGFFSFFKKGEKVPEPAPVADTTPVVAETTVAETTAPRSAPNPQPAPRSTPEPSVAPAPAPAEAPADSAPVPAFAGVEEEEMPSDKKEKKGLAMPSLASIPSIPNPIPKIRPPKKEKPVDMTGAETIIADGEIVQEEEDIVDTNIVATGTGQREPPRVVNGVTTYSSWDDVEARSVSAADKILNSIR